MYAVYVKIKIPINVDNNCLLIHTQHGGQLLCNRELSLAKNRI